MAFNIELLPLPRCLGANRKGRQDQDWPILMSDNILCPNELHEGFTEAAISKNRAAPLVGLPMSLARIESRTGCPA